MVFQCFLASALPGALMTLCPRLHFPMVFQCFLLLGPPPFCTEYTAFDSKVSFSKCFSLLLLRILPRASDFHVFWLLFDVNPSLRLRWLVSRVSFSNGNSMFLPSGLPPFCTKDQAFDCKASFSRGCSPCFGILIRVSIQCFFDVFLPSFLPGI